MSEGRTFGQRVEVAMAAIESHEYRVAWVDSLVTPYGTPVIDHAECVVRVRRDSEEKFPYEHRVVALECAARLLAELAEPNDLEATG